MKDKTVDMTKAAPASAKVHTPGNQSTRPDAKGGYEIPTSAPSDNHTLGRAPKDWLK